MADPQTNFEIQIEKLVYGGDGLARREGRVVLVPFVLPGETVDVRTEGARGGVLRARVESIRTAAPERVEAPCPYFGRCGGCHCQHAPYSRQLELKRDILVETLRRVGKFEPPGEIAVLAGEPWAYRNRSQFHAVDGRIGYMEAHSHRLCPVESCPISSPKINEALAVLNEMVRDRHWPRFLRSFEVFTNETDVQLNVLESAQPVARRFFDWCAKRLSGWVPGPLDYTAGEFTYRVGGESFFQVNRFLAHELATTALERAQGESALDLYAGVGLFSLTLARRFRSVTAVESGMGAARDLRFNAERASLAIDVVQSPAEAFLDELAAAPDYVLADPPRAGLGKAVVKRLAELRPRRLTIVACDPATLARDIAALAEAGYSIERLVMVDLFPQTYHIETIVDLVDGSGA